MADKNEQNFDHLTLPAGSDARLPDDSPAAKAAIEYRDVQLNPNPTEEDLKRVGIPVSQPSDRSQVDVAPASEFVYANSFEDLPEGVSGRIVADGVFEIFKNADASQQDKTEEIRKANEDAVNREREAQAEMAAKREARNREAIENSPQPDVAKIRNF